MKISVYFILEFYGGNIMNCPKCGEPLSDDVLFCSSCGAKIERNEAGDSVEQSVQQPVQPVQQPEEAPVQNAQQAGQENAANANTISAADIANKAKAVGEDALNKANAVADSATAAVAKVVPGVNKKILIIAAAALVVIIVACFIIFGVLIGNAGSSAFAKVPHAAYFANNDGELALFIDGKVVSSDAEYKSGTYFYAYNGNALVYNGVLYKIDGNKLVEVNDSVSGVKMSRNANALLYVSDDAMYIYKNGKENLVFDDFTNSSTTSSAVISPNGSAVMFFDKSDDEIITYVYKGSKAEKLGKNLHPLVISDNASAIYALKYDVSESGLASRGDTLYFLNNGNADDPVKVKGDYSAIKAVSKDGRKILFTSSSGTYYFAPNLKESVKVDSGSVTPVFPDYTIAQLDDFKSFVGLDGASVKKFTLKGDSYDKYTIASAVESYKLSIDGKKLLYKRNGDLYSISTTSDNAEPVKLIEDVALYGASSDLSKIYAVNYDDELVFSNGKSTKPTRVDDDAEKIRVSMNGVCCYVVDDALYTTSGGSKGAKVDKMSDVASITLNYGSYFYVYNDDVLYVSSNGRSFDKTNVEK